jgi:hypothetical protein
MSTQILSSVIEWVYLRVLKMLQALACTFLMPDRPDTCFVGYLVSHCGK